MHSSARGHVWARRTHVWKSVGSGSRWPRARRVGPCPRGAGLTDTLSLGLHPQCPAGSTSPEPSPREKSPLCTCWWHRSLDSTRLRQAGTQEGRPGPPKHTLYCFSLPGVTRASIGFPFAPRVSLRGPACHEERGPVPREEGGGGSDTVAHTAPVPAHDLLSGQRHSVQPLAHRVGTETGNRESLTL